MAVSNFTSLFGWPKVKLLATFRSVMSYLRNFLIPGNIILLGEYYVLWGGKSLCLPTRLGQRFKVERGDMSWSSFDQQNKSYYKKNINLKKLNKNDFIENLFLSCEHILKPGQKFKIESTLEYPFSWGLGSSASTLVGFSRIFGIDPFDLFTMTQKGSGYDVAVSLKCEPLIYQINKASQTWQVNNFLKDHLFFLPLGEKVDSSSEVSDVLKNSITKEGLKKITTIVTEFENVETLEKLNEIIFEHDTLISELINKKSLKSELFSDYPEQVKYLGAWGGDMALVVKWDSKEKTREYFKSKGYESIFSFSEFIKS
jgi:mevalonate kinase